MLFVVLPLVMVGCDGSLGNNSGRAAPALAETPTTPTNTPPKKAFLESVGDTATRIVQEPVRIFSPKKEPTEQPEVYDPPSAIIIRRGQPDASEAPAPAETAPSRP